MTLDECRKDMWDTPVSDLFECEIKAIKEGYCFSHEELMKEEPLDKRTCKKLDSRIRGKYTPNEIYYGNDLPTKVKNACVFVLALAILAAEITAIIAGRA